MKQQLWDKFKEHIEEHISWPATKDEILDACQGEDVTPEFLQDINEKLPEGDIKYSLEEAREMLVESG